MEKLNEIIINYQQSLIDINISISELTSLKSESFKDISVSDIEDIKNNIDSQILLYQSHRICTIQILKYLQEIKGSLS